MKFSITNLEQARKAPVAFAKLLKSGSSTASGFSGYPKSMRWLNAICEYHKNGNISEAYGSLEKGFSKRKNTSRNRKEVETFMKAIDNYRMEIEKGKLSLIKSRETVDIELNPQIRVSGIIPIILMNPLAGFSAYFIGKINPAWQGELKFPIIQSYIATDILSTSVTDVEVGYVDYFTGQFYKTTFSQPEVESARKEMDSIGQTILVNL